MFAEKQRPGIGHSVKIKTLSSDISSWVVVSYMEIPCVNLGCHTTSVNKRGLYRDPCDVSEHG